MIFNRSPFKTFSRALVDGVFTIPRTEDPNPPHPYLFVIDNANEYLLDDLGEYLVVHE